VPSIVARDEKECGVTHLDSQEAAFASAVKAGHSAFVAGPMIVQEPAVASTPEIGRPFAIDYSTLLFCSSGDDVLASRPWFLLFEKNRTSICGLSPVRLPLRLSWCSPASLETKQRKHRELTPLRPVG
jgi:hypothetical protein